MEVNRKAQGNLVGMYVCNCLGNFIELHRLIETQLKTENETKSVRLTID